MQNKKTVIVIASYNELDALPVLISKISPSLNQNQVVIIADDSPIEIRKELIEKCEKEFKSKSSTLDFSFSANKNGRGAAIYRGIKFAQDTYGFFDFYLECDSDGSHRAEDIFRILNTDSFEDLLIGSRYLPESKIIGWPISRTVFSKLLNLTIPRLLKVPCKDITNGLRRYSNQAIQVLLGSTPKNSGFIYLSEQAQLISKAGLTISEIPIIFENRIAGESTVGVKEIFNSFIGVIKLLISKQ
jgi:dolichol-phosphate mannosyltransferase